MAPSKKRMTIPGSEKKALPDAKMMGPVNPDERMEVTLVLRPRGLGKGAGAEKASVKASMDAAAKLPEHREYLSREDYAAERGADPDDVARVEAFANAHHLTVVEASVPKRMIRLAGTVRDLTAAFQPTLKQGKVGNRVFRMRTGGISVPSELGDSIVAVLGFDDRPAATPHLCFLNKRKEKSSRSAKADQVGQRRSGALVATARKAAGRAFTPPEVAKLYKFPRGLDGRGQCIAILEFNDFDRHHKPIRGGFTAVDLAKYFTSLGLPVPSVTAVGVASDHGSGANVPGHRSSDGEVMLDIEMAGAVAPRASIAVYFALNTDNGFLAALNAAIHDTVRKPSVISISYGSAEEFNTRQFRNALELALQDAAALGVTVCCSAGDGGSSDLPRRERDGRAHVDFPASSAFALACGGTKLIGSGTTITSEVVWNDAGGATGGGVSNFFSRPDYQAHAKVPKSPKGKVGRGVPDVAGNADPNTGYKIRVVGGKQEVIGGTSAVAPLWAGLIALMNQRMTSLGKPAVGFLNPLLYQSSQAATFRDIVSGNNDVEHLGKYYSRAGWDACTGLGTPDATKLLSALGG